MIRDQIATVPRANGASGSRSCLGMATTAGDVERDNRTVTMFVSLEGELDAPRVAELRSTLANAAGDWCTVIDLRRVHFIDSAGVGCLIGAIRRARELGGRVVLRGARAGVARVFATTGVDRLVAME